ncbi:cupin-like domain-containing protein [Paenibacillus paeoniae]|nr:cupin-like domain-containing protein [Paenibacillus paeoniae]
MEEITRIQKLSAEEFFQKYYSPYHPVVITDWMEEWGATSKWSNPDYLKEKVGNKVLPVARSDKRLTLGDLEKGYQTIKVNQMDFHAFMDTITSNERDADLFYYLQQIPISTFPELAGDFQVPEFIQGKDIKVNLWLGSGGNITPTHFDPASNFLAQVKGEKKLMLYAPNQTSRLYPFPFHSSNGNLSRVDVLNPNLDRYPRYKKVQAIECTLKAGEMLFLPAFWWHSVETITRDYTISLNFWWDPPMKQYMTPLGLRTKMTILYHRTRLLLNAK